MQDPKYKPEQWVLYDITDSTTGFGKVTGGAYDNEWVYYVVGLESGEYVPENSVVSILENGNWTRPQHFSGENSAYSDSTS